MVSKTSANGNKKASVKPAAKKISSKTTVKKTAAKTMTAKVVDKQVPVKENIDPMKKVMEIKAKNEEKKASKKIKKEASSPVVAEKGAKAVAPTKSKEIKEVAQKVAAKKFAEIKETTQPEKKSCCCCCKGLLAAWKRAYKNMFNFKGRTSRYEFWGFTFINLIFTIAVMCALVFLIDAIKSVALSMGVLGVMTLFIIALFFTYLSLSVRRLHDTGNTAWKGFFKPVILSSVFIVLLAFGGVYLVQHMGTSLIEDDSMSMKFGLSLYVLVFFVALLVLVYYLSKTLLTISFFEEDEDNMYGQSAYTEKCYKVKAFKLAALYYVLVFFINMVAELVQSYSQYGQN